jgi:predicted phage tail protein
MQDMTGVAKHSFEVKDFSSLFNGLRETFPDFGKHYHDINHMCNMFSMVYDNKSKIVPPTWLLKDDIPEDVDEIWLVPVFNGAGGRWGKVLIGVAIIAIAIVASYYAPGIGATVAVEAGTGATAATTTAAGAFASAAVSAAAQVALGIGINLVLSGLFINQLKRPDDDTDKDARRNNSLWEGLVNTTDQSVSVAIHYGNVRVAGQILSGAIQTIDESTPYNASKGELVSQVLNTKG